MLTITTRAYHANMPFDEYLAMPGYSYSTLKDMASPVQYAPTAKMRLGTDVHNYLLESGKYNHENRDIVVPIARELKAIIGDLLPFLKSELAVTCDMHCDGFTMPYKGRMDLCRTGKIVVDLKISKMPLERSIPFFGYDRQLSGYALANDCSLALILRACPETKKTENRLIRISSEWWERQVVRYGKADK